MSLSTMYNWLALRSRDYDFYPRERVEVTRRMWRGGAPYREPPPSDVELLREEFNNAQVLLDVRLAKLSLLLAITSGTAATTWALVLLHVWGVI